VAKYTLDAMLAEMRAHDPAQPSLSLRDAAIATSADKRRMRMVLALVTMTDREARLKPRMREFIKEIRQGLAAMLKAGGLEGTTDQVAFLHCVVVGQGMLQLLRDNDDARDEARRVITMAIELLHRKS
jgi:hypothetical protein